MLKSFTLLALASLVLTVAAYSFPTLAGPTGEIATPTAQVTPTGGLVYAADYYFTQAKTGSVKDSIPVQLLYGIAPNTEIGIGGWLNHVNGKDASALQANVKYVLPWQPANIDLAGGVIFANTQQAANPAFTQDAQSWEPYLVGTHHYAPWLNSTLGANWTQLHAGAVKGSGFRGTAGLEVMLPYRFTVAAEYQTANAKAGDAMPLSSIAVRYPFTPSLEGQVGYTNASFAFAGTTGAKAHNFVAGLCYMWGGKW